MKTIGLAAILALTSTAAFAGSFQFSIGGGTARIHFDDNCSDRLCASVSWQEHGSQQRMKFRLPEVSTKTISKYIDVPQPHWNSPPPDDDEDAAEPSSKPSAGARQAEGGDDTEPAPQAERDDPVRPRQAEDDPPEEGEPPALAAAPPSTQPAPQFQAPVTAERAPAAGKPPAAPTTGRSAEKNPAATPSAEPDRVSENTKVEPTKVANVAPRSATEAAAVPSRPTPVGEWLVEDGEGRIRIEACGANLCGYVSAAKNPNEKDRHNPNPSLRNRPVLGTPILINMEPDGKRWSGRIYNVKDGRSYTAHISLRNAHTLRVEGCAFGGMICGGQNWSRVN